MKILITGSSGFVACHLIPEIISCYPQCAIVGLDVVPPVFPSLGVRHVSIDIGSDEDMAKVDLNDFDLCIHLAALCKEPGFEWRDYFRVNFKGTQNVVSLCERLGIKNIVF